MSRAVYRRSPVMRASPGPLRGATVARGITLGLAMLALAACSPGGMGGEASSAAVGPSGAAAGQTDLATQQACRRRVNEMYDIRNRSDIYAMNPSSSTPFSANYQPDVPSRGLSGQFAYDRSLAECEHNAATGAEQVDIPPAAPPPSTARGR